MSTLSWTVLDLNCITIVVFSETYTIRVHVSLAIIKQLFFKESYTFYLPAQAAENKHAMYTRIVEKYIMI